MTDRKTWRARPGDYQWIDDQPQAGFGGQGGGDGGALPLTARQFREAQDRGKHGVCSSPSCGRALVPEPGYEDTWSVEVCEANPGYTTRHIVRVCSEACGRQWIASDIDEHRVRMSRRQRRRWEPEIIREPGG